jgi:hypothetical protein
MTATVSPYEQNSGPLLWTAQAPYTVIGPDTDLQFDPSNDFVYTDPKRAYFVEAVRWYEYGSQWRPVPPSNPSQVPFQIRYTFHRFYHPYTNLFWHEIFNGGLPALYQPALQASPATVDPSHSDNFSFKNTYTPVPGRVHWGEDGEIIDFTRSAPYSVYNWELFFHLPYYIAQSLNQNQQDSWEVALKGRREYWRDRYRRPRRQPAVPDRAARFGNDGSSIPIGSLLCTSAALIQVWSVLGGSVV